MRDLAIAEHIRSQKEFSEATFGPGPRVLGVCDHIRKELAEVEKYPTDLEEWVDVITLAFDGAWRAGYTGEQIAACLTMKLEKNKKRTWPDWRTADCTKAIEHDRSAE